MPTTEPLDVVLESHLRASTEALLLADPHRMACLRAAAELNLPDWALGAGFIRNLIWDHLHHIAEPTPLNDIDLIYLDRRDPQGLAEVEHEAWLTNRLQGPQWEVRNQARMHTKQLAAPFSSALEALSHWVELPTCVGVRLTQDGEFEWLAPYGLANNWSLHVNANPKCRQGKQLFCQRVRQKRWQAIWPNLHINGLSADGNVLITLGTLG